MSVSPRPCATKRRFGLRFGPVWPLVRCPDSGVLRTPFSKHHSGLAPVWSGLAHLTAGSKRFECVLSHTFTAERRPHRAPRLLPKGSSGPPEPTATSREGSPVSYHSCAAAAPPQAGGREGGDCGCAKRRGLAWAVRVDGARACTLTVYELVGSEKCFPG